MEFEEMKNMWQSLDERLSKQELVKDNILKEIIRAKVTKGLGQLMNYTYFGLILGVLAIGLLSYKLYDVHFGLFKTFIFFIIIAFLFTGIIAAIGNLLILHKIDYTKDMSNNIKYIQRYKIRANKQRIASYCIGIAIIALTVIACILSPKMELWRWLLIGLAAVACAIACIWEYKRVYKENISSIIESLDKLKELEE